MGPSSEERWQAVAVLHRYCWAIDHHDEPALRDVFDAEAVLMVEPPHGDRESSALSGRDAVVGALASLFPGRAWARHFVSNELVEQDPDGALTISCYFRFVLAETAGPVEGLGDYQARLVDRGDRLVISRLAVSILERKARSVR